MVELDLNIGQIVSLHESGQIDYEVVKSSLDKFSKDDFVSYLLGDTDPSTDGLENVDELPIPGEDEE